MGKNNTTQLQKPLSRFLIIFITLVINIGIDRFTKFLAVIYLKGQGVISVIGKLFILYYVENNGAFLNMGANWFTAIKDLILLIIPIAVCLAGIVYCFLKEKNIPRLILITTIIAGGLSNLFDRVTNNFHVIDFMNFGIGNIRTGILNVADLSITFGFIILVIYEYIRRQK